MPSESKRQPSLFLALLSTTKSLTVSESGPDWHTRQSISSSVLCLQCPFVSHRSFTAPVLRPSFSRRVVGGSNFLTIRFKWRSIIVKRRWLCPPQSRATYTAEPAMRVQGRCWSGVSWALRLSSGSSTSVGMRDWNFSICSGLARFFRR